jgi:hypothetical protein
MKSPLLFFFSALLFLADSLLLAQPDTTAHLDNNNKKNGFWALYLDSLSLATDSSKAWFQAFEYYTEGKNHFPFYSEKWKKKDSAVFTGTEGIAGNPVLLNGKFTWFDRKSQMITYEQSFENGRPAKFKEIRYKKKKGHYTWAYIKTTDFTKRSGGLPGTYYILEQNNQAIYNLTEWVGYWYRPGKRGWKRYRVQGS